MRAGAHRPREHDGACVTGRVFLNPGTGDVRAYGMSRLEWATANMRVFAKDVGGGSFEYTPKLDGEGRYGFVLGRDGRKVEVLMPGVALSRVRYMDEKDQNIWHFPRLYIDGDSWVWLYAVGAARDALEGR